MEDYEHYQEQDKQAFVQHLLDSEMLTEPAEIGVARLFVDQGSASMTDKQRWVLETHVLEAHRVSECSLAGDDIPWSEQIDALDNGGMCAACAYQMEKTMRDD